MTEALPFGQVKLASPQGFLCPLPIRNVLNRAKHQIGPSRCVPLQVSQAVHSTHFTAGTNDAVFGVGPVSTHNSLLGCPENEISILSMDQFADCRDIYWPSLRL
jgi:hypothetical protein